MPLHDNTMINESSFTPRAQIIHFSSRFFSLLLTLGLMPSNIQSVMTSLTWHNAIPTWQLLSNFVISRDCTRTPKSRNYSSPSPSDQADNTQYRRGEPGPKIRCKLTDSHIRDLENRNYTLHQFITTFGLIRENHVQMFDITWPFLLGE